MLNDNCLTNSHPTHTQHDKVTAQFLLIRCYLDYLLNGSNMGVAMAQRVTYWTHNQ